MVRRRDSLRSVMRSAHRTDDSDFAEPMHGFRIPRLARKMPLTAIADVHPNSLAEENLGVERCDHVSPPPWVAHGIVI
jgi:hypothetical protein